MCQKQLSTIAMSRHQNRANPLRVSKRARVEERSCLDENLVLPPNLCLELGDIFLSVETAIHQAKEHNHSLNFELQWLVSHGFLHLLGWDHPSSASLEKMLAVQENLIERIENLIFRQSISGF